MWFLISVSTSYSVHRSLSVVRLVFVLDVGQYVSWSSKVCELHRHWDYGMDLSALRLRRAKSGYLYWGDWQKLELDKTDWTQTSDQEWWCRESQSEHDRITKHKIDWDSAECVTYSTNYYIKKGHVTWVHEMMHGGGGKGGYFDWICPPLTFFVFLLWQVSGLLVSIAGFICAIVSVPFDHLKFAHGGIGLAIMIAGLLQPINAFL